jgi:hypothetical protein
MKIRIPFDMTEDYFKEINAKWNSAKNVSLEIPLNLTPEVSNKLIKFLLKMLPCDLASTILADLVDREETPIKLLESNFEYFDTGLQVSICTRKNLSRCLINKCLSSLDSDVIEHIVFHKAITITDCENLLKTETGIKCEVTIRRAIDYKSAHESMGSG